MATKRETTVKAEAAGNAMTLDELGSFVQEALRAGANGDEPVKIRANWSSGIRAVQVTVTSSAGTVPIDQVGGS